MSVLIVLGLGGDPAEPSSAGTLPAYLALNAPFVLLFAGLWLVVRRVHHRPLQSLVTSQARVDRGRLLQGFLRWAVLLGIASVLGALVAPDGLRLTFDPGRFLLFLPVVLVLTTLQASVEELFFRGHLLQGTGLLTRRRWALVAVTAVLFAAPHLGNRELASGFLPLTLYYLAFGVFLGVVTVWDNRLELAIGVHVANNLFGALLFTFEGSSLQTPAIFTSTVFEPWRNLVTFAVLAAVFAAWTFAPSGRGVLRTEPGPDLTGTSLG